MKRGLPLHWIAHRRRRNNELAAGGIPTPLAWRIAKTEAEYRHSLVRSVGFGEARKARLTVAEDRQGRLRWFLCGGNALKVQLALRSEDLIELVSLDGEGLSATA